MSVTSRQFPYKRGGLQGPQESEILSTFFKMEIPYDRVPLFEFVDKS